VAQNAFLSKTEYMSLSKTVNLVPEIRQGSSIVNHVSRTRCCVNQAS